MGGMNQMNMPRRNRPAANHAALRASLPSLAQRKRGQEAPLSELELTRLFAYQARKNVRVNQLGLTPSILATSAADFTGAYAADRPALWMAASKPLNPPTR